MTMKTETAVAKQDNVHILEITPVADIYENKEGVSVYVDLPGVSRESLDINVDKNVLTIKGVINLPAPERMKATYTDVTAGAYKRRFTLSSEMDVSKIDATLKNGELKLFIPRSEMHKPRNIEVKAA